MHYSHAQTPIAMTKWSRAMAKVLTKHYTKNGIVPVFVYTGMSGIATMTALSLALVAQKNSITFGMMYVRKADENSHGQKIETCMSENTYLDVKDLRYNNIPHEFVFVDDFICNGTTLISCALAYQKYMKEPLVFSSESFVVMTGERRKPQFNLTPMFGPDGTPSYKETVADLNGIMALDFELNRKERERKAAESRKAMQEFIDSI